MKKKGKKDIIKGILMTAFGLAVPLIRYWLFPDNEALKYIALFIGVILANNGSRLLFWGWDNPAKEKTNTEPLPAWRLLVMAGFTGACSAGCFWASHSNILPGYPFAVFGLLFLIVTTVIVLFAALRTKYENNKNAPNSELEDGDNWSADKEVEETPPAEDPLMKALTSHKIPTFLMILSLFGSVLYLVAPHLDPNMSPEEIKDMPIFAVLYLLLACGCAFLARMARKEDQA